MSGVNVSSMYLASDALRQNAPILVNFLALKTFRIPPQFIEHRSKPLDDIKEAEAHENVVYDFFSLLREFFKWYEKTQKLR